MLTDRVRRLFWSLLLLVVLCAWSYQATMPLSIRPSEKSASEVVRIIEDVGRSLGYRQGRFTKNDKTATTLDEDDVRYRLYFVNEVYRTSFKVEVKKTDASVNIVFEEFGVVALSAEGLAQYQLLRDLLTQSFGLGSRVPGSN